MEPFRVQGSGFRVQGSGFRVQGSGYRVRGSGFRVQGSGFRVQGGPSSGWRGAGAPWPRSRRPCAAPPAMAPTSFRGGLVPMAPTSSRGGLRRRDRAMAPTSSHPTRGPHTASTPSRPRGVVREQWLQRHPEAGSSYTRSSHCMRRHRTSRAGRTQSRGGPFP
jgi:hypothetical protein